MDGMIKGLTAQPGRIEARDHGMNEWGASAVAGERGSRGRIMLDGGLMLEPSIPIASFFGPCAAGDAKLFAAATKLFSAVEVLTRMTETFAEEIKAASNGQVDFAAQPEFRHCLAIGKLARGLALGWNVAYIRGSVDDKDVAERMTIHDALSLAYRGNVFFDTVELRAVAPLSDRGHEPQTIGEALEQAGVIAATAKLAQGELSDPPAPLNLYEGAAR